MAPGRKDPLSQPSPKGVPGGCRWGLLVARPRQSAPDGDGLSNRKNAELYDPKLPPRQPGQRGRRRLRGERLPSPSRMAADRTLPWRACKVEVRGRLIERLIYARVVLWWFTCREAAVQLVIVRDPSGRSEDEYLFTTDSDSGPEAVVSAYADRWAIEETHRNCKQFLGAEDPQCWRRKGPERAGAMSLFTYSLVWNWYVVAHGDRPSWQRHPWYGSKAAPPSSTHWPRQGVSYGATGFSSKAIAPGSQRNFRQP